MTQPAPWWARVGADAVVWAEAGKGAPLGTDTRLGLAASLSSSTPHSLACASPTQAQLRNILSRGHSGWIFGDTRLISSSEAQIWGLQVGAHASDTGGAGCPSIYCLFCSTTSPLRTGAVPCSAPGQTQDVHGFSSAPRLSPNVACPLQCAFHASPFQKDPLLLLAPWEIVIWNLNKNLLSTFLFPFFISRIQAPVTCLFWSVPISLAPRTKSATQVLNENLLNEWVNEWMT